MKTTNPLPLRALPMAKGWQNAKLRRAARGERQRAKAECRRWPAVAYAERLDQIDEDWDTEYQLQLELEWAMATDRDEFDMLD